MNVTVWFIYYNSSTAISGLGENTYATISGASESCESFRKKWSTEEVFIKPAIQIEECHSIVFYAVFVYV